MKLGRSSYQLILYLHGNIRQTRGSKMSEKKVVRRSVAIALGIICIILVAGLGIVLFMGYSPTSGSSVTSLQNQINDLNATYSGYIFTHSHTDSDYNSLGTQNTNLQNQINQLQAWFDGNKTLLSQTRTWLEGNITDYNSRILDLQNEIASLNSTYNTYVNNHSYTNEQYQNLQNQITNLQNQVNDLTSNLKLEKSEVWATSQTVSQLAGSYSFWIHSANYAGYVGVRVESSTTDKTYVEFLWNTPGIDYDKKVSVGVSGEGAFPVLPHSNLEVRVGNSNVLNGATETVTITYYY